MFHGYYSSYQRELFGCVHLGANPAGFLVEYTEMTEVSPAEKSGPPDQFYVGLIVSHVETIIVDPIVYPLSLIANRIIVQDTFESRVDAVRQMGRMVTTGRLIASGIRPGLAMRAAFGTPDGYRLGFIGPIGVN